MIKCEHKSMFFVVVILFILKVFGKGCTSLYHVMFCLQSQRYIVQ